MAARQGPLGSAAARTAWLMVRGYRLLLSPWLGGHCRFYPSCSVLAEEALEKLPVTQALYRIVRRVSCCHPWHPGGFDPLTTFCESHRR